MPEQLAYCTSLIKNAFKFQLPKFFFSRIDMFSLKLTYLLLHLFLILLIGSFLIVTKSIWKDSNMLENLLDSL